MHERHLLVEVERSLIKRQQEEVIFMRGFETGRNSYDEEQLEPRWRKFSLGRMSSVDIS